MKRIIMYSDLKPEKVEDYVTLHKNAWPELLEVISESNIHNYSISVRGTQVFTFYEYTGHDYDADMKKLDENPIMQEWWKFSKPCFLNHDKQEYYEDLEEIFYLR